MRIAMTGPRGGCRQRMHPNAYDAGHDDCPGCISYRNLIPDHNHSQSVATNFQMASLGIMFMLVIGMIIVWGYWDSVGMKKRTFIFIQLSLLIVVLFFYFIGLRE